MKSVTSSGSVKIGLALLTTVLAAATAGGVFASQQSGGNEKPSPPLRGFPPAQSPSPRASQISAEEARDIARIIFARFGEKEPKNVSADRRSYGEVVEELGISADPRVSPQRPVWYVLAEGEFKPPRPAGVEVISSTRAYAIIDAYGGYAFQRGIF